ncbi:YihY/virulence factor BrkB family protein [Rhodococcus sp. RS1C4]|uniref:YihY/virulence factor BrkB family protein n=1 Tax=Nocardiaceae TaxID=85025 RepID=UPI000371B141|nr:MULTISPECIES: YihY/virulence factor BrkB family protein [Rhodococcus]OZC45144.1 YihY/virulence factor BrkB family protein [Rhodococcus sp. RS1C4]OZC54265.1 YihY/virulence factor BrkB family protein [Rhodococcus sp. 06-621-2]OZC89659.1 YihY/virulence factor BrkB family protein [Rhodococcus sp. 06-418-1B]OZD05837.1 YihY/virulence factor BrkB family protein [Rhodococcus sp. 06-156-4C]OZD16955.1 YihY/virulence factor BrkB family protein [Rhodococcus sp. 06-156-4a]
MDRMQRRHPVLGFPLAVIYKFVDDQGGYLAALIAYYAFVSLFPLLLLASTILGIVLAGNPELQQQILDSALSQIPIIGQDVGEPERIGGGTLGLVVGVLGSLYGGLGVAVAVQNAMNTAWAVPKNLRPDPIFARVRGLALLSTVGVAVLAITAVNVASSAGYFGRISGVVVLGAVLVLNVGVFVVAFRLATARSLSLTDVLPGAIVAGVIWQLLQTFGGVYIKYVVSRASVTNGVFAVVLGVLAFMYIAAVLVVIAVEINVVRVDKLYPRALLTPFTDDVQLTEGDRLTYTGQAEAQRSKGFEEIEVTFDGPRGNDHAGDEKSGSA